MAAPTPETPDLCKVYGGTLVPDVTREFDATTGPIAVGPASAGQFREVRHGYYCENCGLKYKFPPGKRPPKPVPSDTDESLRFPSE